MGGWGYSLFQSDADIDVCDAISSEAAKLAKDPQLDLNCPEDPIAVADKLNAGVFDQLFVNYEVVKWDHGVIFLGGLAMQLGARVTIQQIATLHKILKCTDMYGEAKAQMHKGLNDYRNIGEPYNFGSLGLLDTMSRK